MIFFIFGWVKATVPRYRYDQLMRLGWKVFLPLSLAMVVTTAVLIGADRLQQLPHAIRRVREEPGMNARVNVIAKSEEEARLRSPVSVNRPAARYC